MEGSEEQLVAANTANYSEISQNPDAKAPEQHAQIMEAARQLCAAQHSTPEELERLFVSLHTLVHADSHLEGSVHDSPDYKVSPSKINSTSRVDSAVTSVPGSVGVAETPSSSQSRHASSEIGSGSGTSVEHINSYECNERDADADGSSPALAHTLSLTSIPEGDKSAAQTAVGKSSSIASDSKKLRHKGGISNEREQELLQELAEEQEAHEATRNELEASGEALEAAIEAANDAAEQEEAAALEVAAMRRQLEQLMQEYPKSTQRAFGDKFLCLPMHAVE